MKHLKFIMMGIACLAISFTTVFAQKNVIQLKNLKTERYALSTGKAFSGKITSDFSKAPKVVGTDNNYYDRANWKLIPVSNTNYFYLKNVITNRYLLCPNEPIRTTDAQDGGWSKNKAIVGSDANYYNRAQWKITKTYVKGKVGYLLYNVKTNRLLMSTGSKPTKDEKGWTKSPKLVSADANYYHRAVWHILGDTKLLTAKKTVKTKKVKDDLLLSSFKKNELSTKHWYNIEAKGTNKVLDIAGGKTTDRTNIGLYTQHSNQNYTNQHFKFVSKGNSVYEIYARSNPKSLIDDSSVKGTNGANVHFFTGKNKKNQRFKMLKDKDGYVYFKSIIARDSYLGWKGSNLQMVKYTGKGSEKKMQFELKKWRTISTSNIPLHIVSNMVTTKKNGVNVVKYDVKKIDYVSMKTSSGTTMGKVKLNFEPETAKDKNFLYAYLKLDGAKIEMQNYITQKKKKGFYLKDLTITMTTKQGFEIKIDNPENINTEGKYTKSESFSIGANASNGGAGGDASYSWGSSFTRSIMDFGFTNQTQGAVAQFHWNLSGGINGKYENYRSLGVRSAGQYTSLSELPAMAKDNFPIDCEVVFRKNIQSLPNKVIVNINIKATFEKTWLWNDDANGAESFFNGFGVLVNPNSYKGELLYKFDHSEETTENNIEVQLDLSKLK